MAGSSSTTRMRRWPCPSVLGPLDAVDGRTPAPGNPGGEAAIQDNGSGRQGSGAVGVLLIGIGLSSQPFYVGPGKVEDTAFMLLLLPGSRRALAVSGVRGETERP